MLDSLNYQNHKMYDNFTYHPYNFNAVTEGEMLFVMEIQLYPFAAHSLRSLTLILCYVLTLERNL